MIDVIKSSKLYFFLDVVIWFVAHNLPILIGLLIQTYFDGDNTIFIASCVCGLVLIRIVCILIGAKVDITAQHKWANFMYKKAYTAIEQSEIEAKQGEFINALNEDVNEIVGTISYMIDTACNLIYGIIVIVILGRIDINLTAFVTLFPILTIGLNSLIKKSVEKYSIQSKEYSNRFSEELLNLLNHSREIRVSRKEDDYSNSLDEIVNQQKCIGFKFSVFKGLFSTFSSAVTDCNLIVTIFWYMHFKTLSPGAYVLFITYSFDLSSLAIYMSTLIVSLQSTKVYIQDFYKKIENKKRKRISIDDSILSKIEYNTINVLVGKNGSGKSMSLEYINTQLPDSVMLPENYHLMDVSKKENICLNQDIDYDNSFLEDIPNEHVGNDNLSGGQQFRMVLMRTLLTDAKIILIDNNFMSVDSKLREKIFEYLKKSGKTIVFTDHLYRNEYKEFSVIEV